jgi:hypothetical protein
MDAQQFHYHYPPVPYADVAIDVAKLVGFVCLVGTLLTRLCEDDERPRASSTRRAGRVFASSAVAEGLSCTDSDVGSDEQSMVPTKSRPASSRPVHHVYKSAAPTASFKFPNGAESPRTACTSIDLRLQGNADSPVLCRLVRPDMQRPSMSQAALSMPEEHIPSRDVGSNTRAATGPPRDAAGSINMSASNIYTGKSRASKPTRATKQLSSGSRYFAEVLRRQQIKGGGNLPTTPCKGPLTPVTPRTPPSLTSTRPYTPMGSRFIQRAESESYVYLTLVHDFKGAKKAGREGRGQEGAALFARVSSWDCNTVV